MADGQDLVGIIGPLAQHFWGEPNARLSNKTELRFGSQGSKSVNLEKGTWFSFEEETGGGVLDLVQRETGTANGDAFDWLREHGFEVGGGPHEPPKKGTSAKTAPRRIVATYDYVDEAGELLFQCVRYEPKGFSQRRPDGAGGWTWSLKGAQLVPYRLPELLEALGAERTVFIVEGEKDANNLAALGLPATCGPMGAGKFPAEIAAYFKHADVVIIPDNDEPGRKHVGVVAQALQPHAGRIRVLELPHLGPKEDVSDWIARGGDAGFLNDLVDGVARDWVPGEVGSRFGAVWWRDAERKLEEPEWLVDDMLTTNDLSLVYGPSQSGKSFFAQHISTGIARGEEVLGHKVKARMGVVYIAAEGKKGFKKRLRAYRQHFSVPLEADLDFVLLPVSIDLFAESAKGGSTATLIEEINALAGRMRVPLGLVVIDTLAASTPGANENAGEDMSRIMKHCAQIQELCRCAVMIVHHKNAAGDKPRGHTSLYAGCDNAIEVIRDDDTGKRTATLAKLKDGEDGGVIPFRLEPVTIGHREDGKAITSCVVMPADAPPKNKGAPARSPLPPQSKIALRALRDVLITYGEPAPAVLQLPYGVRVVKAGVWKTRFCEMAFDEAPTDDAARKAIERASQLLKARNIIAGSAPYVWIAREPEGEA